MSVSTQTIKFSSICSKICTQYWRIGQFSDTRGYHSVYYCILPQYACLLLRNVPATPTRTHSELIRKCIRHASHAHNSGTVTGQLSEQEADASTMATGEWWVALMHVRFIRNRLLLRSHVQDPQVGLSLAFGMAAVQLFWGAKPSRIPFSLYTVACYCAR